VAEDANTETELSVNEAEPYGESEGKKIATIKAYVR
jgi:hypothetical protein